MDSVVDCCSGYQIRRTDGAPRRNVCPVRQDVSLVIEVEVFRDSKELVLSDDAAR